MNVSGVHQATEHGLRVLDTSGLFVAYDFAQPRLVWDPSVHKYYGEDLSFVVLKLEHSPADIYSDVRPFVERAGIRSFSVYRLYGYYDALLRIWAPRPVVQDFLATLQRDFQCQVAHDFLCHRAYFDDWSEHRDRTDDRYLSQYEADIEAVLRGTVSPRELQQAVVRLKDASLLHHMDPNTAFLPSDGPTIKVYCALSRRSGTSNNLTGEIRQIREITRQVTGIKVKSLYFGGGAGGPDVILEGLIRSRDYPLLDGWINEFYQSLTAHGRYFRPMTLFVADADAREGDVIDLAGFELGDRARRLRRIVNKEYAGYLNQLTTQEVMQVLEVYDKYRRDFVGTTFERFFLGILEARLGTELELLEEKLTYLQRLERWLREVLEHKILPDALGRREWFGVVAGMIQDAPDEAVPSPISGSVKDGDSELPSRKLTLGQYARVLRRLLKEGRVSQQSMENALGPGWQARLTSAADLRNAWAHGSLKSLLTRGGSWNGWPVVAEQACEAGILFLRLQEAANGDV